MWVVHEGANEVSYGSHELVDLFALRLTRLMEKEDHLKLVRAILDYRDTNKLDLDPDTNMLMGFALGYQYRLFLEKNNVMFTASDPVGKVTPQP